MGEAAAAWESSNVRSLAPEDQRLHLRMLEAILFASATPLSQAEITLRMPEGVDLDVLLHELQAAYAGRGVNLRRSDDRWAFRTAEDLAFVLKRDVVAEKKLSRAAVETLAVIAYHQPVTRAEIEEVRGVGLSKGTLDLLFEQNWIRPVGRRRAPGKPVTWGTTDFFLEHFGLPGLDDLPGQEELKAAGLLDPRAQPPIFRTDEPDLPLEPGDDEADEPLAADETGR